MAESAIELVGALQIIESYKKQNRLTHLFGMSGFARRVREKFGGGAVGLTTAEQGRVVKDMERRFDSHSKNTEFYEERADFSRESGRMSDQEKGDGLRGLLSRTTSLEELADWHALVQRTTGGSKAISEEVATEFEKRRAEFAQPYFVPRHPDENDNMAWHEHGALGRGERPGYYHS